MRGIARSQLLAKISISCSKALICPTHTKSSLVRLTRKELSTRTFQSSRFMVVMYCVSAIALVGSWSSISVDSDVVHHISVPVASSLHRSPDRPFADRSVRPCRDLSSANRAPLVRRSAKGLEHGPFRRRVRVQSVSVEKIFARTDARRRPSILSDPPSVRVCPASGPRPASTCGRLVRP